METCKLTRYDQLKWLTDYENEETVKAEKFHEETQVRWLFYYLNIIVIYRFKYTSSNFMWDTDQPVICTNISKYFG